MASYKVLPVIATLHRQYDLITRTNFALTGTASTTPMDGVTLTNGMKVVIDYASKYGVYDCAVSADAYTLTLSIDLGTSATNNIPFLFEISQGSNIGLWNYTNINSTPKFSQVQISNIVSEKLEIAGSPINSNAFADVVITYTKTYASVKQVSVTFEATTNDHNLTLINTGIVYNTNSLTGQTIRIFNFGATAISNYNVKVEVSGS